MTKSNNDTHELTADELDAVAGGLAIGPIHVGYSKGAGAVDIGIGSLGIWFGRAGMGWYAGDSAGRIF